MTTFTVPRIVRAIDEAMFADLGIPVVAFTSTANGGVQVDCPGDVSADVVIRCKMRLLTDAQDEATWVYGLTGQATDLAYLALTPATDPLAAQVYLLTQQCLALMQYIGREALRP